MKLLEVSRRGNTLTVRIHVDETRVIADPDHLEVIEDVGDGTGRVAIIPDPAYVREWTHGLDPEREDQTIDEQIDSAVSEDAYLVHDELISKSAPEDLTAKLQLPQL